MRWLVLAIVLVPLAAAADDGYYSEVSAGPVQYRGELAPYAKDTTKVHVAFSARRGAFTYELITGGILDYTQRADCPAGTACRVVGANERAELDVLGGNVRYRMQLGRSRWQRFAVHASVYGGPRWWSGSGALEHYTGTGIGGGSRIELDVWVIGYFVDVGMDVARFTSPGDELRASMPYMLFGGKVGWL